MATFQKRGKGWRTQVRRKGYSELSRTFDTKADATKWARSIEGDMDRSTFIDRTEAESTTLKQALERYLKEITPSKKGAKQETDRIKACDEKTTCGIFFGKHTRCRVG